MKLSKKKYIIFMLIGAVAGWFNVFAPLHEIWHVWFSSFSGGDPIITWNAVYMERGTSSNIVYLAGFYGEVLLEAALSLYFLNKGKAGLAGLFAGVFISAAFLAPISSDFARYEDYIWGLYTVWWIYVAVVTLFLAIVTIITYNSKNT